MFAKKQNDNPLLDKAIEEALRNLDPNDSDYLEKVEGVERLMKLKEQSNSKITPDTLAIVAGNILGIVLILHHEKVNVVSSKAVSLLMKLR